MTSKFLELEGTSKFIDARQKLPFPFYNFNLFEISKTVRAHCTNSASKILRRGLKKFTYLMEKITVSNNFVKVYKKNSSKNNQYYNYYRACMQYCLLFTVGLSLWWAYCSC
jgi:hypothetical protein